MAKKDSNILEIKLERVLKKSHVHSFNNDLKPIPNHPASVSVLWTLPEDSQNLDYQISQSFGKMYVGESFTSSLRIKNISQAILERVTIICNLKYSNAKNPPVLFQADIPRILPEATNRFAFTLNVDVSDVFYLNLQAHFSIKEITEPISVGKLFKFEAKVPVEFQSKVIKADEGFIVQSRVTNQSIYTINIDLVDFVCSGGYKVIPYNPVSEFVGFNPGEIRSFLYHVIEAQTTTSGNELGRIVITWFSNTGDIGSIPSPPITHNYKYDKTLKITVENKPKYYLLEEPSCATFRFFNLTNNFTMEDVKIEIYESLMNNFVVTPLAPTSFSKIKPQESVSLLCAVFPKVPGIVKIEGIKVFSGKKMLEFEPPTICIKPS